MSFCPHPEKAVHRTKAAALKARASVEAQHGIQVGLEPYRCGDHWHLGHRRKLSRFERRMKKALRKAGPS